jgi:hypothetical protein
MRIYYAAILAFLAIAGVSRAQSAAAMAAGDVVLTISCPISPCPFRQGEVILQHPPEAAMRAYRGWIASEGTGGAVLRDRRAESMDSVQLSGQDFPGSGQAIDIEIVVADAPWQKEQLARILRELPAPGARYPASAGAAVRALSYSGTDGEPAITDGRMIRNYWSGRWRDWNCFDISRDHTDADAGVWRVLFRPTGRPQNRG